MDFFQGYHAEWNLGCPGGWEYQRMAQERGNLCWSKVKKISGLEIELTFDHPLLNPMPSFIDMLLRVHSKRFPREKPFILLVAERDTLDKVTENINLVEHINRMDGVGSALTCPEEVEETRDSITYRGQKVTVVFLDINNDVLIRIGKSKDITALMKGISKGITVNPRGMEPVGAKGIFEAVTGELRSRLTPSTVRHTPWTRLFYPRTTGGPDGETISDLIAWTKDHWMRLY